MFSRDRVVQVLQGISVMAIFWIFSHLVRTFCPDKLAFQQYFASQGTLVAPMLFILLFMVGNCCFVPNMLFLLTATFIWNKELAFCYSYVGALGGCILNFVFARTIGKRFTRERIPSSVQQYHSLLLLHPLGLSTSLHFIFFLFPPTNWFFGISNIHFRPFFLGCVLGLCPGIVMWITVGKSLARAFTSDRNPHESVLVGLFLGSLLTIKLYIAYRWKKYLIQIQKQEKDIADKHVCEISPLLIRSNLVQSHSSTNYNSTDTTSISISASTAA